MTDSSPIATSLDLPSLALPKPTGKYAVGTTEYSFIDSERDETYTDDPNDKREITAKVWYPSEEVPNAKTAPYLSEEYSQAIATAQQIPSEDFQAIVESIETNSVTDAPLAETESEYPVLIFSHGFGDLPELNSIKAEELASQGYIVVGINHTYDSAVSILDDGQIIPASAIFTEIEDESQIDRLLGEAIEVRSADARFVLDELEAIAESTDLLSGIDLERTGIFGYSLGGATAAKVLAEDDRFGAGINLDGGLFGDSGNASLTQPFMFQNNQAFGAEDPTDERLNQLNQIQQSFVTNLQNDGYEVTIDGTEHNNFNDLSFLSPFLINSGIELGSLNEVFAPNGNSEFEPILPQQANEIINSYSTAFFNRYLSDRQSSLLTEDPSPYPEVTFQTYPVDNNDITGLSTNQATGLNIFIGEDIVLDSTLGESILELTESLPFDELEIVRGRGDNSGDLLVNYESETIAIFDDIISTDSI